MPGSLNDIVAAYNDVLDVLARSADPVLVDGSAKLHEIYAAPRPDQSESYTTWMYIALLKLTEVYSYVRVYSGVQAGANVQALYGLPALVPKNKDDDAAAAITAIVGDDTHTNNTDDDMAATANVATANVATASVANANANDATNDTANNDMGRIASVPGHDCRIAVAGVTGPKKSTEGAYARESTELWTLVAKIMSYSTSFRVCGIIINILELTNHINMCASDNGIAEYAGYEDMHTLADRLYTMAACGHVIAECDVEEYVKTAVAAFEHFSSIAECPDYIGVPIYSVRCMANTLANVIATLNRSTTV